MVEVLMVITGCNSDDGDGVARWRGRSYTAEEVMHMCLMEVKWVVVIIAVTLA